MKKPQKPVSHGHSLLARTMSGVTVGYGLGLLVNDGPLLPLFLFGISSILLVLTLPDLPD